jgi:hypothetical protein
MDSASNANIAGVPFSFHTVLLEQNRESLGDVALCAHSFTLEGHHNGYQGQDVKVHILRFVKQGRGASNGLETLSEESLDVLPAEIEQLGLKYPRVRFSYSNSFEGKECDCGSMKAVVTCYGEVLDCSALKYGGGDGRFACRERI